MSGKTKFTDYEPLNRPEDSRKKLPENLEGFQPRNTAALLLEEEPVLEAPDVDRPKDPPKPSLDKERLFWKLPKGGHGLTFVGLFLFTVVLYIRPYEIFPSLIWLKGIAFWIAIPTILIYIPSQLGIDQKLTFRPRQVNMLLLLFFAAVLSVPLSSDRQVSWDSLTDYLKVVLMFIVFINVVRTEARLKLLLLLILIVSCVMSFAAVNDYRMGILASNGQRIKGIIGGMFDNPNDLALHLVTLIPISIGLMLSSRAVFKKLFYATCAIVLVAGVVVSFSRGGFLGLVCAGGMLGWRLMRRNKGLLLIAPLIVAAFIALAPGGYGSRLATTSDGSAETRTDDLKRSIFIAIRHPVVGVGMGNYVLFSNKEHASHNAYTQVASELGIAALVFYLLFQIASIKDLREIIRETEPKGPDARYHYLAIGFEAALVGYMVCSFFASVAFLWYIYYLVGYSICLRRLYESFAARQQQETAPVFRPAATHRSSLVTAG